MDIHLSAYSANDKRVIHGRRPFRLAIYLIGCKRYYFERISIPQRYQPLARRSFRNLHVVNLLQLRQ